MTPVIHRIFAHNALRNFNYVIESAHWLIIIDPYEATQVAALIDELNKPVMAIINTHEHHDHTRGNHVLSNKYQAPIWAHPNGRGKIADIQRTLPAGEKIELDAKWNLTVMDTPGHTHAHLCLLLSEGQRPHAIFTGDTLFNAGVGNCHNGGDPEVLFETIRDHFMQLPDEVLVYPGHDYLRNNLSFTLDREPNNQLAKEWLERHKKIDQEKEFWLTKMGQEKQINTFLRLDSLEIREHLPNKPTQERQIFLTLRELRNHW